MLIKELVFDDGKLFLKLHQSTKINEHIQNVAKFRIKYFKDFPYLYNGNLSYEKEYLSSFTEDSKSILISVTNEFGKLLGISTALPIISSAKIVTEAPKQFKRNNLNPEEYFYYSENILYYSIRGRGLAKEIYSIRDRFSKNSGFTKAAIATVDSAS